MTADPNLPEPLTPPECNLRGLAWMPLDVARLMESDFFAIATGDEFKAAVALWCRAWTQVPAGSLPADERVLAHLSGAGAAWPAVRTVAMRGWVKCFDGRFYHPVVAEKAMEALDYRQKQRDRAAKRWNKPSTSSRDDAAALPRDCAGNAAAMPIDRTAPDQTEQIEFISAPSAPHPGASPGAAASQRVKSRRKSIQADGDQFEKFWSSYPRKVGKGAARKAWPRAVTKAGSAQEIIDGLTVQLSLGQFDMREDGRFCPHPGTWLNGERWVDGIEPEPAPDHAHAAAQWTPLTAPPSSPPASQADLLAPWPAPPARASTLDLQPAAER